MKSFYTKSAFLFFFITGCNTEVSQNDMFAKKASAKILNGLKVQICNQDNIKKPLLLNPIISDSICKNVSNFRQSLSLNSFLKYSFSESGNSNLNGNKDINKGDNESYSEFVRVIIQNKEGKLLVLRTNYGDNYFWIFPGGKVEKNESLSNAAEREVLEETGLKLSDYKYLGEFMSPRLYKGVLWKGYVYLAHTNVKEIENLEPNKCSEVAFKSYEELLPLVIKEDSYVTELILKQFVSKL